MFVLTRTVLHVQVQSVSNSTGAHLNSHIGWVKLTNTLLLTNVVHRTVSVWINWAGNIIDIHNLIYTWHHSPIHVLMSGCSMNPSEQLQLNPPTVLVHICSQLSNLWLHSLTSESKDCKQEWMSLCGCVCVCMHVCTGLYMCMCLCVLVCVCAHVFTV